MKKILITFIVILLYIMNPFKVESYYYEGKDYNIYIPENIEIFDYKLNTGNCNMKIYGCKVSYINMLLIKKGMKSLY